MPLTTYPPVSPVRRRLPNRQHDFSHNLGIVAACVTLGLSVKTFLDTRLRPLPRPQPFRRVTVYDVKTGQVFLSDIPYVREERLGDDKYFFRFKNGGERFLDLSGHDYRIVRREV